MIWEWVPLIWIHPALRSEKRRVLQIQPEFWAGCTTVLSTDVYKRQFLPKYESRGIRITADNAEEILKEEVGLVFARVLEDAGVYKCTEEGREAFGRFLKAAGFKEA